MDPVTLTMLAMGIGKAAMGAVQKGKADKLKKNNPRPDYEIADETFENVGTYEQQAQEGFGQDSLEWMHQQALRGLSSSLSAGLQMGGDANTANDYYQSYLDATARTGTQNAMQRFQNINLAANARAKLAEEKFIEFGYDKDAPYKDRAQAATLGATQGLQNIMGGLDMAGSAVVGQQSRKLYAAQTAAMEKALTDRPVAVVEPGISSVNNTVDGPGMARAYLRSIGIENPEDMRVQRVMGQPKNRALWVDSLDGMMESAILNNNLYGTKRKP